MAFYPSLTNLGKITTATNVELDYPISPDPNSIKLASMMEIVATVPGVLIIMPSAIDTTNGFAPSFNNVGAISFDIVKNSSNDLISTIKPGEVKTIYLEDNTTIDGNWRVIPFGGGTSDISFFDIVSTDSSVVVTDGSVTSPGGTVDLALQPITGATSSLSLNIPGIVTIDQNAGTPWGVTKITGGSNITVTNEDGIGGDVIVNLDDDISLNKVSSTGISIEGEQISTIADDAILSIITNGASSLINLNGLLVNSTGDITAVGSITALGSLNAANVYKAACRFTNASGVISVEKSYNVSGVTYNPVNGQYTITFTTAMSDINYYVNITCSNNNSTPPLQVRIGNDVVRQTTYTTVVLYDGNGEILVDIPEGVSVIVS